MTATTLSTPRWTPAPPGACVPGCRTSSGDKFYIRVADTRLALRALASAYRDRFAIPFVQITGSVGKTTTKEMIAAVLGRSSGC